MSVDFDMYGDLLAEDIDSESQDFLMGGSESAFCYATWLSGMADKTPIVIKQGNKWVEDGDKQAAGIWFEAEKTPDNLREIIDQMALTEDEHGKKKKPTAEFAHVQHDDGTVKLYWRVFDADYFVLAHGVPSQWSVMRFDKQNKEWSHSPEKQLGIARGTRTDEDSKNDKQSTYNFFGFLVIMRQLADKYVDENGRPIPLAMNFKSINTGVMERELGFHFNFLKAHREWYVKTFLPADEGFKKRFGGLPKDQQKKIAQRVAQHHIQFWTHSIRLDKTKDRKKHESKSASAANNKATGQKVYEPQNWSVTLYDNHEDAEKVLYCGDGLYKHLQSFVYDTSVQPIVPGGDAVENCRKRMDSAYNNQLELNPYGDNQFGSNKQRPAWMAQRSTMKSHGLHDDQSGVPASMQSNTTARATATVTQGDRGTKMRINIAVNKLKEMHAAFEANKVDDGMHIWPTTAKEMKTLDDAGKLALLKEARSTAEELLEITMSELGESFVLPEVEEEY